MGCNVLQCVAVCCGVLQCVAVGCIELQCAAVCCSVLQRITVCCSVLQRVLTQDTLLQRQRPSVQSVLNLWGTVCARIEMISYLALSICASNKLLAVGTMLCEYD